PGDDGPLRHARGSSLGRFEARRGARRRDRRDADRVGQRPLSVMGSDRQECLSYNSGMPRIAAALAAIACFLAIGCEKHATVIPTDPGTPGTPTIVITIATDRGTLEAGSAQPATLTITAKSQDGTP